MTNLVPSYLLKVRRAKLHLQEVEGLVAKYVSRHPYTMCKGVEDEDGNCTHRFEFTEQPDELIAIVAGDVIHNVRSGLNHLAAACVPPDRRDKVQFPIFDPDPFEIDPSTGQLFKNRGSARGWWDRYTTGMQQEAITFLKSVQPYAPMWQLVDGQDGFSIVEKLSNHDKHCELIVLATGLNRGVITYTYPDGKIITRKEFGGLKDGALDTLPVPAAVDVKIKGTPAIALNLGQDGHFYEVLGSLQKAVNVLEILAIRALIPYIWVDPAATH